MNIFKKPAYNNIFVAVALVAFLGGLLISLVTLMGFGYGGFESVRFNLAAAATFVSTGALFIGLLGAESRYRVFAILILAGSGWLAFSVGSYATSLLLYSKGTPWTGIAVVLLLVLVEGTAVILSSIKLIQRRSTEVSPCPQ